MAEIGVSEVVDRPSKAQTRVRKAKSPKEKKTVKAQKEKVKKTEKKEKPSHPSYIEVSYPFFSLLLSLIWLNPMLFWKINIHSLQLFIVDGDCSHHCS